jgi:hypothetical protein
VAVQVLFRGALIIARFKILLPYEVHIPQSADLQPYNFTRSGYQVTIYPPLQVGIPPSAVEASSPVPSRDILEQLVPVDPPEVNSSVLINGIPTIRANMLQADFHKDDFDRRPPDPLSDVGNDTSDELIFELINEVLSSIRSVTQSSEIKPLSWDNTHWRLDYLTDDLEELPQDGVNIRRRFGAAFRWHVCAVTQEVWDKVQTTAPTRRPPNWESLYLTLNPFFLTLPLSCSCCHYSRNINLHHTRSPCRRIRAANRTVAVGQRTRRRLP